MRYDDSSSLKSTLRAVGVYGMARWIIKEGVPALRSLGDTLICRRQRAYADYTRQHTVRNLHIGCGDNFLPGWFNTDLYPNAQRQRLNATQPYPFPDNSFDYIFTEHMIEHVPYAAGRAMLTECFRVLTPGGVIRLVTPDLKFLIDLYQQDDELRRNYIEWSSRGFIGDAMPHDKVSVINNFFRDWGHQYIYDMEAMRKLMQGIGFTEIIQCQIGSSMHYPLMQLEHTDRMPQGFLGLESLIVEAKKPL